MSQYEAVVNLADSNLSHTLILEEVGTNKSVLDLGCASGYLAEALVARGCTVSGVEYDPLEAAKARPHMERLVVGDLNRLDLAAEFSGTQFEVVVCGDVLEHLLSPATVLRTAASLLAPGGSVVISIPNVGHGSLRLALMAGEWNYTSLGLLDETHIKFFTYRTLVRLVEDAGLVIEDSRYTVADALATEVMVPTEELPVELVDWVRERPFADAYQFVVRAVPRSDPADNSADVHGVSARPAVEPARVEDEFFHAARRLRDERAATAALARDLQGRVVELELERDHLRGVVAVAAANREDLLRSATWRAGRVVVAPLTRLRRLLRR